MADTNLVREALSRGYSLDEIADVLGKQSGFDAGEVRARGYGSEEIIAKLGFEVPEIPKAKVQTPADLSTLDESSVFASPAIPRSVMDGYQAPDRSSEGTAIAGAGPMRADAAERITASVRANPQAGAKLAAQDTPAGRVAQAGIEQVNRRASGDVIPRTMEDVRADVEQNTLPDLGNKPAQLSEQTSQWAEKLAKDMPYAANAIGGVMSTGGGVWGALSAVLPDGSIPEQVADVSAQLAQKLQTDVQKQDFLDANSKIDWVVQQGIANAPSAALSMIGMFNPATMPLVLGTLSASSGGGQYRNLRRQGVDRDIATAAGIGYGVLEMLFERVELGVGNALLKRIDAIPVGTAATIGANVMRGLAKGTAKAGVVAFGEGTEEINTEAGQIGVDVLTGNAQASRTGESKLTRELTNLDPGKVGNKLVNAFVGGVAGGAGVASMHPAIGAYEGYQAGQDLTAGLQTNQQGVDQLTRGLLSPDSPFALNIGQAPSAPVITPSQIINAPDLETAGQLIQQQVAQPTGLEHLTAPVELPASSIPDDVFTIDDERALDVSVSGPVAPLAGTSAATAGDLTGGSPLAGLPADTIAPVGGTPASAGGAVATDFSGGEPEQSAAVDEPYSELLAALEVAQREYGRSDGETSVVPETGLTILHGSGNANLSANDIQIVRTGQKQGKKGRTYGGLYGTSEADIAQAEGYAQMMGGTATIHNVSVKPGTKVLHKVGDITRLSEAYINELVGQGYGLVIGKDPRGRTEYVVIDKNAIGSISPRTTAPQGAVSTSTQGATNDLQTQGQAPTEEVNGTQTTQAEQGQAQGQEAPAATTSVKAYDKATAERYATRFTAQGLPSAVVPHPTEAGKFAIVDADAPVSAKVSPGKTAPVAKTSTFRNGVATFTGVTADELRQAVADNKITAQVTEGKSGVKVSGINLKQKTILHNAVIGKDVKAPKARALSGNLKNDLDIIAPGLFAHVQNGGDGEANDAPWGDLSLIAERLRDEEGYMLPFDSENIADDLRDLISQHSTDSPVLNEKRILEANEKAQASEHRSGVLREADALGLKGTNPRRTLADVEAEIKQAVIERAEWLDAHLDELDRATTNEVNALLTEIENDERAGRADEAAQSALRSAERATEGDAQERAAAAQAEGGTGFALTGQTEAEIRADQTATEDQSKAETDAEKKDKEARIAKEVAARQDVAADNFSLEPQVNDKAEQKKIDAKKADTQLAGQGDIFAQPIASDSKNQHNTQRDSPPEKQATPNKTAPSGAVSVSGLDRAALYSALKGKTVTLNVLDASTGETHTMDYQADVALRQADERVQSLEALLICVRG